jgi:phosphoserine phosphatase
LEGKKPVSRYQIRAKALGYDIDHNTHTIKYLQVINIVHLTSGLRVESNGYMTEETIKRYLFASDFDQTLSFDDSGYVLSEMVGIPAEEFERKLQGMTALNLVQQGAELAYLLLHDPEFRARVRRDHLVEVGKRIPLKENIRSLYQILADGIPGYQFDFYVLSAAPVEVVRSALDAIVPADHIFGTEFRYSASGEIETIVRATAGYGKVQAVDLLKSQLELGPDRIVYAGDGSSDIHVMLHVNSRDGLTVAVSESKRVAQIAKRTVLSTNALSMLVPILEEVAGWPRKHIREFIESHGFTVQEWARSETDWVTLRSSGTPA